MSPEPTTASDAQCFTFLPHTPTPAELPGPAPEQPAQDEPQSQPETQPGLDVNNERNDDVNSELSDDVLLAGSSTEECSICFGPMSADIVRGFPNSSCPHEFCAECLAQLLRVKRAPAPARLPSLANDGVALPVLCPQCRRPASTELTALLAQLPVRSMPAAPSADELRQRRRRPASKCFLTIISSVVLLITPLVWWSIGIIANELQKD